MSTSSSKQSNRKRRTGVVVSNKSMKTIVVQLERKVAHPTYNKIIQKNNKVLAHDEKEQAVIGETVEIEETRPLSKRKCWRLIKIIKKK